VRLAYHAGALIALEEAGITYGHVDGTSGGIFGAAMLGSGIPPTEQAARWRKLRLRGFIQVLPAGNYLSQARMKAFGGSRGIRNKIFPSLGISEEAIRANKSLTTTFNVCNFSRKTLETIDGCEVTTDHLIAGMSLAAFSPAVRIGGDWYTDAIWIRDANLTEAVKRGAEEIWLVWCIGNTAPYLNGVFNQYVHMIEISANAGLFQELAMIRDLNSSRKAQGLAPLTLHIVKPPYALPLDPDFFLNGIDADTLVNMGYAHTTSYLQNRRPFSFEDIPAATTMPDAGLTVHFRQQFAATLQGEGFTGHLLIRLGFFIRENEDQLPFRFYASVQTDHGQTASGYELQAQKQGKGCWQCRFLFRQSGAVREIRLLYRPGAISGFRWGLDPKTAAVTLLEGGVTLAHGICRQSASRRLKNRWHLHVSGAQEMAGRRRRARKLLDVLFE
jgi:hypothetical protein